MIAVAEPSCCAPQVSGAVNPAALPFSWSLNWDIVPPRHSPLAHFKQVTTLKQHGFFERHLMPRRFRLARSWSNRVLADIAPLFEGAVVNVSGWEDKDKEGGSYQSYFSKASRYVVTNYGGQMGDAPFEHEQLDLEGEVPPHLVGAFDVVFNHTVLEHVFEVDTAVKNLCLMSKDVVIVVVPFFQEYHGQESFSDYWRFTFHALERMFAKNDFKVIWGATTPYKGAATYHVCVASKTPEKWRNVLAAIPGTPLSREDMFQEPLWAQWGWIVYRMCGRILSKLGLSGGSIPR